MLAKFARLVMRNRAGGRAAEIVKIRKHDLWNGFLEPIIRNPLRRESFGLQEESAGNSQRGIMTTGSRTALVVAILVACSMTWVAARQRGASAPVPIDPDDIGGVVTSVKGPEAGVWVIAETTDLPTKFARIVVTDDQGRYVMPDLPKV